MRILSKCGISKAILVIGYQKEQIQNVIGHRYEGIEIEYVINQRFAETNTAYSLWLAREYLSSPSLIIEGDILFDVGFLHTSLVALEESPPGLRFLLHLKIMRAFFSLAMIQGMFPR